jgi:hypothetical protein
MFIRWILVLLLAVAAPMAEATFHLFRIEQLYSNADGTVQFVVLRESSGADGENQWSGRTLRMTGPAGTSTLTFPSNLPSADTGFRRVLVATPGFAALGLVTPDFIMPAGFLQITSGTLNFAGVHQVTYATLPTDGANALSSSGAVIPNVATNFAGASASVAVTPATATVVEYFNAALDHYFITHLASEMAVLDAGITIKGWARTGQVFKVFVTGDGGRSAVCRFYIPPAKGDSHFFGRGTKECDDTAAANPTFVNEDPQFLYVILPAAGVCPAGTVGVYRVFSNRPDANHRYMIDRAIRDQMVTARNWLAEGDGPDLIVMCVPPATIASLEEPPPGLAGYKP